MDRTNTVLAGLKPEPLWRYFHSISRIPRCSGNETGIVEYIEKTGRANGLEVMKDAAGNVLLRKKGSHSHSERPPVALQAHVDMVCEKNGGVEHDFGTDPIQLRREGDILMAKGTTLGADNGMGVAAMLALAESRDLEHPPLELLFTVEEETGLSGALHLNPNFLESRRLLNLDTEEEGVIYVGCAGGGDTTIQLPMPCNDLPSNEKALVVTVRGLKGGHSGIDIHLGRGNSLQILARLLLALAKKGKIRIGHGEGGDKRNAIPREAHAVILAEDRDHARERIAAHFEEIRREYEGVEDSMELHMEEKRIDRICEPESTLRLLTLITALPHGPLSYNAKIPGLVDTSSNVASLRMEGGVATIQTNTRSSYDTAREAVRDRIEFTAKAMGARVIRGSAYPGWKPDLASALLRRAIFVHEELFGKRPECKAVHAGLETGIIGEKYPGMEMISIGPEIRFPHSPDERVYLGSVERFWSYLTMLIGAL